MKDHARDKIELNSFDQISDVLDALEKRNIPYSVEAVGPTEWGYKGFHITWRNSQGIGTEVQLTTSPIWETKLWSDAIYDKWRNTDLTKLSPQERAAYFRDKEMSLKRWESVHLPDFSTYARSSSSLSMRALNNSSPNSGDLAGIHLPSTSSNGMSLESSIMRPLSVMHGISAPPFDPIIPQTRMDNNFLPPGMGAASAGFSSEFDQWQQQTRRAAYRMMDGRGRAIVEVPKKNQAGQLTPKTASSPGAAAKNTWSRQLYDNSRYLYT